MDTPALIRGIESGRTDLIQVLLTAGKIPAGQGANLLTTCSYYGDVTACRLLLAHGQSLTTLGPDLGINGAAFHGHWQLCEFLLENGAALDDAVE